MENKLTTTYPIYIDNNRNTQVQLVANHITKLTIENPYFNMQSEYPAKSSIDNITATAHALSNVDSGYHLLEEVTYTTNNASLSLTHKYYHNFNAVKQLPYTHKYNRVGARSNSLKNPLEYNRETYNQLTASYDHYLTSVNKGYEDYIAIGDLYGGVFADYSTNAITNDFGEFDDQLVIGSRFTFEMWFNKALLPFTLVTAWDRNSEKMSTSFTVMT